MAKIFPRINGFLRKSWRIIRRNFFDSFDREMYIDKNQKSALQIDLAIPGDRNVRSVKSKEEM